MPSGTVLPIGCPSNVTSPADGGTRAAMTSSKVDLPQPDGPTTAKNSLRRRSISMGPKAWVRPNLDSYSLVTPRSETWIGGCLTTSAHFPKFVLHRGTHSHELRKVVGTSKHNDSSAAFLFEVPGSNSPLVVQELQIGGTRSPLYRGFVERSLAGKALFERVDYCFHLRAERALDHDGVADPDGGDDLGFEIRRAIGIAAPLARGKGVPQVLHLRTTTIHEVDVIGLDGVIETAMQLGAARTQFEHVAEHRDPPAVRADFGLGEHVQCGRHRCRVGVVAFVDQGGLAAPQFENPPYSATRCRLDMRQRQRSQRQIGTRKRGGREYRKRVHRHVAAGHADLVRDVVPKNIGVYRRAGRVQRHVDEPRVGFPVGA